MKNFVIGCEFQVCLRHQAWKRIREPEVVVLISTRLSLKIQRCGGGVSCLHCLGFGRYNFQTIG